MPQVGVPIHEVFLASGIVFLSASAIVGIHLWQTTRETPIAPSLLALIGAMLAFTGHLTTHLINRLDSMNLIALEILFRWIGLLLLAVFLLMTVSMIHRTPNQG